jgi:hypothetical protein
VKNLTQNTIYRMIPYLVTKKEKQKSRKRKEPKEKE